MTSEREIAGFALPFVTGTAFTLVSRGAFPGALQVSAALIPICILFLIHPVHKQSDSRILWSAIFVVALSCGILTGHTSYGALSNYGNFLTRIAATWAENLKNLIDSIPFPNRLTNGITKALLTGDRNSLPPDVINDFRDSGASHILALSGMHLGIIYGMLKAILSLAGNTTGSKKGRSAVIITACGLYVMLTGAGASTVRAFLFILLGEAASISGRHRNLRHILLASLLIQTTFCPEDIRSISFQLSYAAMGGIALIYPQLKKIWPDKTAGEGIVTKCLRWVWNSASMSVACQLTTAPLAWIYFGTFPKYFILTNLITLPLIGIVIPAGLATTILYSLGICPDALMRATDSLVTLITGNLSIIASL